MNRPYPHIPNMKFAALFLLATACFGQCAVTWTNGYSKCIEVTLLASKIPNTDQTDFTNTLCFNGSGCGSTFVATGLKAVGSGGSVTSANCFDCILTSDNAGSSLMNWATDAYIGSTGEVVFKVKQTRSHTVNDKAYLFFGNASVTTFQGGSAGSAYASSLRLSYAFGDGATLSFADGSAAGRTLTNHSTTAGAGKIGGGIVTSLTNYANHTTTILGWTNPWSLAGWVKSTGATVQLLIHLGTSAGAGQGYTLLNSACPGCAQVGDAGGGSGRAIGVTHLNDGNWHLVVGTYDGSSVFRIYADGVLEGASGVEPNNVTADGVQIGIAGDLSSSGCACTLDEITGWGVDQSADWVAALFNNQGSPSTFYTAAAAVDPYLSTSPTNVHITGSTTVAAVIAYSSPYACSIEASEGASIGSIVHDVDPSLFSGSNLDNRSGQVAVQGAYHQFTLGQSLAAKAGDNLYYSRALQAFTKHTARITCPAGAADANSVSIPFITGNITATSFTWPTATADPANPGTEAIPSWNFADRNQKIIDPKSGALLRHMGFLQEEVVGGTGIYPFAFASGADWTNPGNAIANDGSFAVQSAATTGILCLRSDTVFELEKQVAGVTVQLTGKVANGSTSPQQDVEVALTLDGCATFGPWVTGTLPLASDYSPPGTDINVGDDITLPTPVMAAWLSSGQVPPTVLDLSMRSGTVNTSGTAVAWNASGGNQTGPFPYSWGAGTPIEINTTGAGSPPYASFALASLTSAFDVTLSASAGSHTNVAYRAPTFGFGIRPKVAAARAVSIDYARMWVNEYAGERTNHGDGMSTMCSMQATPEAAVITAATNATPIVLTVAPAQAWITGASIVVAGVLGNTAANGTWTVTRTDSTHFILQTSVGNSAWTGRGIAYPPTARTGYQCAHLSAAPGDWQYYWIATSDGSGDAHYLGPLRVSGSGGGATWSGICGGPTISWDWVTNTTFPTVYCTLPDAVLGTKTLLLSATYIGNPNLGYNAEVGPLPNAGNAGTLASWDVQPLSADLGPALHAFDSNYDVSVFGGSEVDGFQDSHVTLSARAGVQDTMGWRIVFDPVTATVSAMAASFLQLPTAYCSVHTPNTNTFNPWITTTLKNLIYEGGGTYNGPYTSAITSNGGTGTGSVSATLSFCDTAIGAIGQTDVLGVGHVQFCSTITVASEPITPPSVIPASSILMPAPIGQPMQFTGPDPFSGVALTGERVRLVAKNGSTWVIQRGYYLQESPPLVPVAQAAGSLLEPLCGAMVYAINKPLNEDCCISWWDWSNDIHATNSGDQYGQQGGDGSTPYPADANPAKQIGIPATLRKEDTFLGLGHFATGSNQSQSVALTFNDNGDNYFHPLPPGTFGPFQQQVAIRNHPWPGHLRDYTSTPIGVTSPFARVYGDCVGGCADLHPSINYTGNPLFMYSANPVGSFIGWMNVGSVVPVSGQLYKANQCQRPTTCSTDWVPVAAAPLDLKRNQLLVQVGRNAPLNVSGPTCSIGTGAGDSWKWGLVYKANECVSGSLPGEVYINAPGVTPGPAGSFIAGLYTPFDKTNYGLTRAITVMTAGSLSDHYVQYLASSAVDYAGMHARKLTTGLNGTANMGRTTNYRPLADAGWAWTGWQQNNGGPFDTMLIKTPPFPPDASVNRTDYIPVSVSVTPAAALNVNNAIVEFGYDSALNCVNRTGESCVAAAVNDPYSYSVADAPITGLACAGGCTLTLNAVPNSILYWRVRYRNASNVTLAVGPVQVVAVP